MGGGTQFHPPPSLGLIEFGPVKAGKYGVYTDVSFYRGWIQEQFDANGGATLVP